MFEVNLIDDNKFILIPDFDFTINNIDYIKSLFSKIKEILIKSKNPEIILDLINVGFIDSIGIIKIFRLHLLIKKLNGKLFLLNVNKDIKEIFTIIELDKIIPVIDSTGEIENG